MGLHNLVQKFSFLFFCNLKYSPGLLDTFTCAFCREKVKKHTVYKIDFSQ